MSATDRDITLVEKLLTKPDAPLWNIKAWRDELKLRLLQETDLVEYQKQYKLYQKVTKKLISKLATYMRVHINGR